jgi:hypothetical protein
MPIRTQGSFLEKSTNTFWDTNTGYKSVIGKVETVHGPLQTTESVDTPGFNQLVKADAPLPVNPFSTTKVTHSASDVTWTDKSSWNISYLYEGMLAMSHYPHLGSRLRPFKPWDYDLPAIESHSNLLVAAEADVRTRAWDMGTFLAELDKTHDLVSNAHKRMRKRVDTILQPRGRKRGVKTLREFNDAWMELRYGWRILQYDMESIQEAYGNLMREHSNVVRARKRDKAKVSEQWTKRVLTAWPGTTTAYGDWGVEFSGHLLVEFENSAGVGHERNFQNTIGFIDPIVTAYEVIPYSFVVDWFANVSQNLYNISPFYTANRLFAWTGEHKVETHNLIATPYDNRNDAIKLFSGTPAIYTRSERSYVRTNETVVPLSLSFKPNLNLMKMRDLMALVHGHNNRVQSHLRI